MTFRYILLLNLLILATIFANNEKLDAQNLPVISYHSPPFYTVDSAIKPLFPVNNGGAVYPSNYSISTKFVPYVTPFSIAIDGSNNIYTTNNSTGDFTKFSPAGKTVFTVNTGNIHASGIAVDKSGDAYVSQFAANNILEYDASGTLLATFKGFSDPYGIAFDASNNAYVANYLSGDILKIDSRTSVVSVYLTGFDKPYGIILDDAGNIYVSEQGIGDIIKVDANTFTKSVFASGFNSPRHLSKDTFGNIYVADFGNNAIKRISPAGIVTNILKKGLSSPRQAAFDSDGDLFVANYGSNALVKSTGSDYAIDQSLPDGLAFNTTTGEISGTPTEPSKGTYTISAYNTGGKSSATITIDIEPAQPDTSALFKFSDHLPVLNNSIATVDDVIIHPAVSPNGDGINDFLRIEGIENYPENNVSIANTNGTTVYTVKGYNNSTKVFDGRSSLNGHMLIPGTYYYLVEYNNNGNLVRKTGFIILKLR